MDTASKASGLVLVVEDEAAIAELIRLYLARDGFGVHTVRDGVAALAAVRAHRPVAVVLDIGLPGVDGVEVVRQMRAAGDWTPVLFVTARDEEVDRIVGLEIGADDYITKPFSPRELVARVKAVLRRSSGVRGSDELLLAGALTLDLARRTAVIDEPGGEAVPVALTATEFDLLAYLMRRPGRVFTRAELLAGVWAYPDTSGTRTIDVHIAQLRSKLGDRSPIRTVRGVGYAVDA